MLFGVILDGTSPGASGREKTGPVVAIDGPAGVGKTTLAHRLAVAVDLPFVSTGLMYRAVAEACLRGGVDPRDEEELAQIAAGISFGLDRTAQPPGLTIDGEPPKPELSSNDVESVVSLVSSHPSVRDVLRRRQRELGAAGCVMEGRDIGTVVFPDADVKILLTASPRERARRRQRERGASGGIQRAVMRRDVLDARTTPLEPAPGTSVLRTDGLTQEEVYRRALELVRLGLP